MSTEKTANMFEMGNQNIFPNIASQCKWRYAKYSDKIQLADDNNVYQFHCNPDGIGKEDAIVGTRKEDPSILDFGKDADASGTLQVHYANPGGMYATMHGGKAITFRLNHTKDNDWKFTSKLSKTAEECFVDGFFKEAAFIELDKESFLVGFTKQSNILDSAVGLGRTGSQAAQYLVNNPLGGVLPGLAAGAIYDQGKRHLYNTDEENQQETGMDRFKRYALPVAGLTVPPAIAGSIFPHLTEGGRL